MAKQSRAALSAGYFALRGRACELVAEYEQAGVDIPPRLLRFAGLKRRKVNKGPKPIILPIVLRWFVQRNNEAATYHEIATGSGLRMPQVRNCVTRGHVEFFERVGDLKIADKLYAKVRLSQAGLAQANTIP